MASTNQTPKLGLPQFVDTDKPGWLTDFNTAMLKIDESVGDQTSNIEQAVSTANEALTTANGLSASIEEANQTANGAQTEANNASELAASAATEAAQAQASATAANNLAQSAIEGMDFDLTTLVKYDGTHPFVDLSITGSVTNPVAAAENILTYCATKNRKFVKLMGSFRFRGSFTNGTVEVKFKTPFQPSARIPLNSHVMRYSYNANGWAQLNQVIPSFPADCFIDPDGTVTLHMMSWADVKEICFVFSDALISPTPLSITSA